MAALIVGPRAQAQTTDLPWACAGTTEKYWVKGFNGQSDFEWRVFFNNGSAPRTEVTTEVLTYGNAGGDTVLISWPAAPERGGLYTFEVVETTAYDCIGTVYTEDIVVNSSTINLSFDNVPTSMFVCLGNENVLDPGAQFINYLWKDGDDKTNRYYTTTEAGAYEVRLIDSDYSCSFHEIEAGFWALPTVDLGPDTALNLAETLVLDAFGFNINNYYWYSYNSKTKEWIEDTYLGNNSHSYPVDAGKGTQWISVVVVDENGCSNSDSIKIEGVDFGKLRIPSAFVPNSPFEENQRWNFPASQERGGRPLYHLFDEIEVRVFNRWGSPVFESSGRTYEPWDGRDTKGNPLPMDSYHYIIRLKISGKQYQYKGSVTIVR